MQHLVCVKTKNKKPTNSYMDIDRSLSLEKEPIHVQSIKPTLLPAFLLSLRFVPGIVLSTEDIVANKQDSLSPAWACSLGGETGIN